MNYRPTARRSAATFSCGGDEGRRVYEHGDASMEGDVHGGLIHFRPCKETFRQMMHTLQTGTWEPYSNCAEQEFLSIFFAGRWHAISGTYLFLVFDTPPTSMHCGFLHFVTVPPPLQVPFILARDCENYIDVITSM